MELKIAHDGALHDLGDGPLGPDAYGLWARETATGPWRLQVNLEPVDGNEWVYRRDSRVRLPIERVILRRAGLPCVDPAVQLLWKAKNTAAKDEPTSARSRRCSNAKTGGGSRVRSRSAIPTPLGRPG